MERTDQTPQSPAAGDSGQLVVPEGTVVDDRYRIVGELGSGGMGIVYRAEHTRLSGRPVALKMLRQIFAGTQDLRPRFEREAHALAALSHPNVVAVTDYGIYAGLPYLTMELVEGKDLRQVLDEGPMGIDRALDVAGQVLEGLAFAHRRGLAHRDLKPANILLQPLPGGREVAKILDFGFAKFLESSGAGDPATLTRSGIGFGTPAYMSPEQATGGVTDARSDVYSMGVLIFEMLTGDKPFDGEIQEIVHAHLVEQVPPLNETRPGCGFSPELEALVVKAMAKKPVNRFADAGEMLEALAAIEQPASRATVDVAAATVPAKDARPPQSSLEMTTPAMRQPLESKVRRPPRDDESVHVPTTGRGLGCVLATALLVAGGVALALWKPELLPGGGDAQGAEDGYTRVEGQVRSGQETDRAAGDVEGARSLGGEARADESAVVPAELAAGVEATEGEGGEETEVAAEDEPVDTSAQGEAADALAEGEGVEEGEVAEGEGVPSAAEPAEAGPPAAEPSAGTAAPNPWHQRPFPRSLASLRRRVLGGGHVTDATIRALREYAREHRDDVRPGLLLGHAYVRRAWLSDALERYDLAYRLSPDARGDPRMLANLVWMVGTQPPVATRAADSVATIYGAEATAAIDEALTDPEVNAAGRQRLETLRARLQ